MGGVGFRVMLGFMGSLINEKNLGMPKSLLAGSA
jgi:hypothetical protein